MQCVWACQLQLVVYEVVLWLKLLIKLLSVLFEALLDLYWTVELDLRVVVNRVKLTLFVVNTRHQILQPLQSQSIDSAIFLKQVLV